MPGCPGLIAQNVQDSAGYCKLFYWLTAKKKPQWAKSRAWGNREETHGEKARRLYQISENKGSDICGARPRFEASVLCGKLAT
jgi:hypothetical protein